MEKLLPRQDEILKELDEKGHVLVQDLCEKLNVSSVTIRKDLNYLESLGLLFRNHGGASKQVRYAYEKNVGEKENINVRGQNIAIDSCFLKCRKCNNSFDDPKSDFDVLDMAYREYRKANNMLQPEDIKNWRLRLNLTQIELARILGFGDVTINRYESGKLQESSHDKAMRLAMKPANLLSLINDNSDCIVDNEKRKTIIEILQAEFDLENSFEAFFNFKFNTYQPSVYSGYKKLNLDKVYAAIIFFCSEVGVFKTKLNKLMFYADFKSFKESAISITGLQYAKLPFGPVPDNYDHYIATLLMEKKILKEEVLMDLVMTGLLVTKM